MTDDHLTDQERLWLRLAWKPPPGEYRAADIAQFRCAVVALCATVAALRQEAEQRVAAFAALNADWQDAIAARTAAEQRVGELTNALETLADDVGTIVATDRRCYSEGADELAALMQIENRARTALAGPDAGSAGGKGK